MFIYNIVYVANKLIYLKHNTCKWNTCTYLVNLSKILSSYSHTNCERNYSRYLVCILRYFLIFADLVFWLSWR